MNNLKSNNNNNTNLVSKFISFNCKNVNRSIECIRTLCKTADIIALQETWLFPTEIPMLGDIDKDFGYYGKSSMDATNLIRGRPYGGVALLWRKSIFNTVSVVQCSNNRIVAVRMDLADRSILVICIYMPTNSYDNLADFCECMSEMAAIVESCNLESVFILGDFNADPMELFGKEMQNFCMDQKWYCADICKLGVDSGAYTFVSDAYGTTSWLDHCLVTDAAWRSVDSVDIYYDAYWSDHHPLVLQINLGTIRPTIPTLLESQVTNKVIWGERDQFQVEAYRRKCTELLCDIDFPEELSACCDKMCSNIEHRMVIDNLYNKIVNVLREAAELSCAAPNIKKKKRYVAGWNKFVKGAHETARQAFLNWVWHGRPRAGRLYQCMCESRKIFKSKLKSCQKNQEQIKLDILASQHKAKNFGNFWKHTKKLGPKPAVSVSVGGLCDPKQIANIFKDHFKVEAVLRQEAEVGVGDGVVVGTGTGEPISITAKDIKLVLKQMTRGKSPGHDSLSIEHLHNAGPHLPRVLSLLYTFCIRHSYLPFELMRTVVVPILKNKTGDICDKTNYRPISLATVLAKVLDGLLERRLSNFIQLNDAQFGFRPGLSTESAILSLKHTVKYYTQRQTPVYAAFLDLSKAFDLVDYDLLWSKLRDIAVPNELITTLKYWYGHQVNQVKWSGALSDEYILECGVRQGGLSSPLLFSLYVDGLIGALSNTRIGCSIDGQMVNSISYADDMVLLSPSVSALRKLLVVCEVYAAKHGLLYNTKKSELMVFHVGAKKPQVVPPVKLLGVPLSRVSQFKYLGHIVTENLTDNCDIERERRALAVRCNMVARRFARCTREVKITLFKAYCQTFYTCSLWYSYTQRAYNALRVQYNNAFRMLMGLPVFCSASGMFAEAGVDDFHGIIRKRISSSWHRLRESSNGVLRVVKDRLDCPIQGHWTKMHMGGTLKYLN